MFWKVSTYIHLRVYKNISCSAVYSGVLYYVISNSNYGMFVSKSSVPFYRSQSCDLSGHIWYSTCPYRADYSSQNFGKWFYGRLTIFRSFLQRNSGTSILVSPFHIILKFKIKQI